MTAADDKWELNGDSSVLTVYNDRAYDGDYECTCTGSSPTQSATSAAAEMEFWCKYKSTFHRKHLFTFDSIESY